MYYFSCACCINFVEFLCLTLSELQIRGGIVNTVQPPYDIHPWDGKKVAVVGR